MKTYETDFYGWLFDQADFLRAGRFVDLDLEHLIEEIESMGRREKRTLESRLSVLLLHMLKCKYQPERLGRSWQLTIKEQRKRMLKILSDNPSLKPAIPEIFTDAYDSAILGAAAETDLPLSTFPLTCPWTFEQVIDFEFYPN